MLLPPRMKNALKLKIRRDQRNSVHADCWLLKNMLGRESGKGNVNSVSDAH